MSCPGRPDPLELILNHDATAYDDTAANVLTVSIGTPGQDFRLVPSTSNPDIALHDASACPGVNKTCAELLGGVYDADNSNTHVSTTFDQWNGTQQNALNTSAYAYFNDNLEMLIDKWMPGVPMMTVDPTSQAAGVLPIGANSTFISQAANAGLITSQSWGLYMGTQASPGSLILGGYSSNLMAESLRTRETANACPVCFHVKGMSIQQGAANTDLMPLGDGNLFVASLEPYTNFIELPGHIFDDFVTATNGKVGPMGFATYADGIFQPGNLTIKLDNTLETTIPSELIFTSTPPILNDKQVVLDKNTTMARIRRSGNAKGVLGLPYMSMVYVVYNGENSTLGIANAQPQGSSHGQFIPLCPLAVSDNKNQSSTVSHSNKAAIIGGTTAGAAALIIIVLLILLLCRRQRRRPDPFRPTGEEGNKLQYATSKLSKDTLRFSPASSYFSHREIGTKSSSTEVPVFQTPLVPSIKELGYPSPRVYLQPVQRSLHEMPVDTATQIDVVRPSRHGSTHSFRSEHEAAVNEWSTLSGSTISWGRTNTLSENAQTLVSPTQMSLRSGPFSSLVRAGKASEHWNRL